MAGFDDIRLPEDIEIGATGGPTFATGIVTLSNGEEQRTQNWTNARQSYKIGYGTSETDYQAVIAFFYARRGMSRGFRFKDWTDYSAQHQQLAYTVGFPIYVGKDYVDALGIVYTRPITRIVPGTLRIYDNVGKDCTPGVQESFGQLTWPANVNGAPPPFTVALYADFQFDVPVRFDTDALNYIAETATALTINTIPILELIESSTRLNGIV